MIAVPGGGDAIEVAALEAWLEQLGCVKTSTPNRFVCVWRAPSGWHFSAPSPEYAYLVPESSRAKLGSVIRDIMMRKPNPRA